MVLTHLTRSIPSRPKNTADVCSAGGQEGPREGSQLEECAEDDDGSGEIPLDAQGGRRWNRLERARDGLPRKRSLNDTWLSCIFTNTV